MVRVKRNEVKDGTYFVAWPLWYTKAVDSHRCSSRLPMVLPEQDPCPFLTLIRSSCLDRRAWTGWGEASCLAPRSSSSENAHLAGIGSGTDDS